MSAHTGKYHLPAGTAADGPYDLLVTPASAGWGYSGLRILTLKPGEAHALSTQDSEFLVLPLTGSCTVTTDGTAFELAGRTGVFASATDFAHPPRGSQALIGSEVLTPGGNRSSYPPHKHDEARTDADGTPVESELEEIYCVEVSGDGRGFGYQRAYGTEDRWIDVLAEDRSGDTVLIPHGCHGLSIAAPAHGRGRATWDTQDVDDRLPFGAEENE